MYTVFYIYVMLKNCKIPNEMQENNFNICDTLHRIQNPAIIFLTDVKYITLIYPGNGLAYSLNLIQYKGIAELSTHVKKIKRSCLWIINNYIPGIHILISFYHSFVVIG